MLLTEERQAINSESTMFTDKEIIDLHKDKKYKKTNSFLKNVGLSHTVIKAGLGGVSISISPATGTISFSVAIISWFWKFLRYRFITNEITNCRSKIIEGLLNKDFMVSPERLIKGSIGTGNMWLEYNKDKINFMENACIEYISTPEHRIILSAHSYIEDREMLVQVCNNALAELERIFSLVRDILFKEEFRALSRNYPDILSNEEHAILIQRIFMSNNRSGNLTSTNNNEEDTQDDS